VRYMLWGGGVGEGRGGFPVGYRGMLGLRNLVVGALSGVEEICYYECLLKYFYSRG